MKKRLMVDIPILALLILLAGCVSKDPIGIEQFLLEDPDGIAPVLFEVVQVGDSVKVEWVDNTSPDSQFKIYRKIGNEAFTEIETIDSMYYEYYDTYAFEDSTLLTYYVETIAPTYTQQSNHLEYLYGYGTSITISVTVDNDPEEASWNLYCYPTSSYYFPTDQTFSNNFENQVFTIGLEDGHYAVHCWDTWGDGGISGIVTDAEANILIECDENDYNFTGQFHFWVN